MLAAIRRHAPAGARRGGLDRRRRSRSWPPLVDDAPDRGHAVVEGVHADLGARRARRPRVEGGVHGRQRHRRDGRASPIISWSRSPHRPSTDIEALYRGHRRGRGLHGAAVVGGDLSTSPSGVVAVTVVGHVTGGGSSGPSLWSDGRRHALRDAARSARQPRACACSRQSGILTCKSRADPSSNAASGRAHKRPVARLAEGEAARTSGATAMIDLSDGLASDVRRIADASGVGIRSASIPVAEGADRGRGALRRRRLRAAFRGAGR